MDQVLITGIKITSIVGMVCAVTCAIAMIIYAVRCAYRAIVEIQLAYKAKLYVQESYKMTKDINFRTMEIKGMLERMQKKE